MKTILPILAMTALVASVVAQMGHHISKNAKHVITCPVSGDKVDIDRATRAHLYADYKGNRYYFCCSDCPPMFKKNPARYAGKPHMPIPSTHKPEALQHRSVLVSNGTYSPATINVKAGKPVHLMFKLGPNAGCGNVLVIESFHINKELVSGKETAVTFTPKKPGKYPFTCGMGMYRGMIIAS